MCCDDNVLHLLPPVLSDLKVEHYRYRLFYIPMKISELDGSKICFSDYNTNASVCRAWSSIILFLMLFNLKNLHIRQIQVILNSLPRLVLRRFTFPPSHKSVCMYCIIPEKPDNFQKTAECSMSTGNKWERTCYEELRFSSSPFGRGNSML